ncbi:MAG TPA: hypothetical protein VFV73_40210 [Streptosporangiaceae bacterium]|nr:hypothetical protein [Streptosporangiaceae bacterium]
MQLHGGITLRGSARLRRLLALATCAFLIPAGLTACTNHAPAAGSNAAPAIGPAPTASLPPGEKTTVRVTASSGQLTKANDLMAGSDRQIGPAYDFSVGQEPSSALITFKVDPSRLASAVGVKNASPTGLYIQIYEPDLRSWVPLKSTYHPGARTVTATAPHLSKVTLSWTDVGCALAPEVCAAVVFTKVAKHLASDVVTNIEDVFKKQDKDEDCASKADPAWKVSSSLKQLSGCVLSSGSPQVHVRNPLLLPMTVRQPTGAPHATIELQPYMLDQNPELTTFVTELIDWSTDATAVAPRSYGVFPVQDLSTVGSLTMATQPDALALVMDFVLSIIFVLPGEKAESEVVEQAAKDVLPAFEAKAKAGEAFTMGDIFDAMDKDIEKQQESAVPPGLTFVDVLDDSFGCVSQNIAKDVTDKIHDDGVVDGVIQEAGDLAKNCVQTAFEAAGKELKKSYQDVLNVLKAVPELGKTIREGVQFAELGPSSTLATTTAQRVPFDLTNSPFFQTPDGNITCGLPFYSWPGQASVSPPASQELDCRINNHTVAPANCADLHYEAWPAASMIPGQYASFACIAADPQLPMYSIQGADGGLKPRDPYHAHDGQNINLGPDTCFVRTTSVDCSSNTGPYTFHLDPGSFRSPLISGDSVLAAQLLGAMYISTSTAVFEPSEYVPAKDAELSGISWTEWNANLAIGSAATFTFNTCQPECAAAHDQIDKDVSFTFSDPMIVCGKWFFTKLDIQDPADSQVSGPRSIAPETDANGNQCLAPSSG